jgi:hypothetical protein
MNAIDPLHALVKGRERTVPAHHQSMDVDELDALGACFQHLLDEQAPFDT